MDDSLYVGREQTLVKHYILRQYLGTFAHKVAHYYDTITYIDAFSGPWNVASDRLEDASFSIAIDELRKARETYAERYGRHVKLRCFFVERSRSAYVKLRDFAASASDVEIKTRNSAFESAVPSILEFINGGGKRNFPLIFIDPTGWTGFAMKTIEPLLQLKPVEILINFMTSHVRRFVESPLQQTRESFEGMFGSSDFQHEVRGHSYEDKEDVLIREYMRQLRARGKFDHVVAAMILDPEISRTAFHLIYATRHPVGLQVFKDVERRAMRVMLEATDSAHRRRLGDAAQQQTLPLFTEAMRYGQPHFEHLRSRYLRQAKEAVWNLLKQRRRVSFDLAWRAAVSFPLVWDRDLKAWVKTWRSEEMICVEGLTGKHHVPQFGGGHTLVFVKDATARAPTRTSSPDDAGSRSRKR